MPGFLLGIDADVIALQEVSHDKIRTETLIPALKQTYPNISRTDHKMPGPSSYMELRQFKTKLRPTDAVETHLSDHHPVYIKYVFGQ